MNSLRTYLKLEKSQAGWRFWVFWVIMINIGFFAGLGIGAVVANSIEPGISQLADKLIQNTMSALVIGGFTGLAQGIVLKRHGFNGGWWAVMTALGWAVGIFLAGYMIFGLDASVQTNDFFRWIVPSAFVAGAVVGVPQWIVLKQSLPTVRWWWIWVSAIGWGVQFPGMVPGWVLTRLLVK